MPVSKRSPKSLAISLLALLVLAAVLFVGLPRVAASLQAPKLQRKIDKKNQQEKTIAGRAHDLANRARQQRQARNEASPGKSQNGRATATAESQVNAAERSLAPAASTGEGRMARATGNKAAAWQQKLGKPFDKPREAAQFFQQKRLAEGEKQLPVEKYFAAQQRVRQMPRFSTRLDRAVTSDAPPAIAPLSNGGKADQANLTQEAAATWTSLGPGNIGGRTRALLINPTDPSVMYAAGVSGGAWKSTNAGQSWTPLGDMFATLTVSSMVFEPGNPNTIYLGTGEGFSAVEQDTLGDFRGAGIFKTTDAGATWTRLDSTKTEDFFFVNDLVISPNDKNRIYAATRTGVWRSNDGGANWTRVLDPLNEDDDTITGGALDLAIRTDQTTDFLFASCGTFEKATVYRNTDAAGTGATNTWVAVLSEEGMGRTSLAIAPSNQNIIYALASSIEENANQLGLYAVFRSTSGGESNSWTAQVRNTSSVKLNRLLLSNPIIGTLTDCQFDLGDANFGQGWYDNVIAVDPLDPNKVWAGGIDLFRSDDGGANWGVASYWWIEDVGTVKLSPYSHADQHTIVFHPNYNGASNQTIYVGGDGGLFRSDNARAAVATGAKATCRGENSSVRWITINNNYGVTQFYQGAVTPNGQTYFGGTQDNGTILGTDAAGVNGWREINGGDGGYVAVDPNNPDTYFASTVDISFIKSTDAGATFGSSIAGINDSGLFITPFAIDPSDGRRLWTGGDFIWRTDNGAGGWVRASAITDGATKVSAIAVAPTDSNRVLVGMGDGYIHRNTAALTGTAATVWPSTRPRRGWVSSVAFDPNNKEIAYATYSTFGDIHVYRSTDGGQSWAGIDGTGAGALPDIPVHSIVVDPTNSGRLYIGTDTGVFVSNNTGGSWAVEDTGFPNAITESLQINVTGGVTRLYAFTHGRGAWRVTLSTSGPNAGCNFALATPTVNVSRTASSGSVNVTAGPGTCNWTAASNTSWLKVTGGGAGNGTVSYTVDENTTFVTRTATATIAGRSFVVTQPGRIDAESPVVAVTDPQVTPAVVNTSGLINLAGTAIDNNAVVGVTFATDRGVAGTAAFAPATGRWTANNIPLAPGQNIITITARDAAGNLGRTSYTVFSKPDAALVTVAGTGTRGFAGDGGQATAALISRPIRLDLDGAGNIYFTDSDNNRVRRVAPDGTITTIAGTGTAGFSGDGGPAASAQLSFPIGVAVDGSGNLYICDNGNQRIRKVTAATGVISTIAGTGTAGFSGDGGPGVAAQINNAQNVEVDAMGNVFIADFANNRIRKVAGDGTITTVAGTGTSGFTGDGDLATAARLNGPNNVSTDAAGNLIISDAGNNRIRRVTVADGKINTIVGSGTAGFTGDGGPALEARLNSPVGAIVDAAGNLYFSDRGNQRVRRVAAGTNIITTIVGTGTAGFNGDGLAALGSALNFPTGLGLDPAGNLYIGDRDNGRIRKLLFAGAGDNAAPTIAITAPTTAPTFTTTTATVNITGTAADNAGVFQVRWSNDRGGSGVAAGTTSWTISTLTLQNGLNNITITAWDAAGNVASVRLAITFNPSQLITAFAGTGGPGNAGDAGPAITAGISPLGLAVNAAGTLFVTDDESHRVRQINAAGTINAFAGSGALGSSGDNGQALNAAFNFPTDAVVDATGNVYIADTNNHRVRRVAPNGTITTYAGTGTPDFKGDGGPATQATLVSPTGLALDAAGNLYIADTGNSRVRKVTVATGVITTVAGNGNVAFAGDNGQALEASFKAPWGLAVDRNGVLYVGDIRDQRIRRVATDGVITTIAGTGTAGYDGDNKPAKEARINIGGSGFGGFMTVDAMNDLYFADFLNNRVRKVTMTTGAITTIAGGTAGAGGDNGDPARAQLSLPTDVAIASDGTIYIADWGNYRIRRIAATGSLRTVASVSAASFLGDALATESIAAAFGTGLASATELAATIPLPTALGGTTVRVRDAAGAERLAPLFFVSPGQVNFQVPPSTASGAATITINGPDGASSTGVVQIVNAAPGLFSANSDGTGVAAALVLRIKASGEQIYEPLARLDTTTNKYVPTPIDLGPDTDQVFLVLFGTGARFRSSLAASAATVGGAPAELLFVGPQGGFAGLDQINLRLNRALIGRGEVDVRLTTDGRQSNAVKIAIK